MSGDASWYYTYSWSLLKLSWGLELSIKLLETQTVLLHPSSIATLIFHSSLCRRRIHFLMVQNISIARNQARFCLNEFPQIRPKWFCVDLMENIHVQNFISGGGVQNILFKGGPPSNFLAKKIFLAQKYVAKNKDSCFKASPLSIKIQLRLRF